MTRILGILNLTRDSFSDGGRYLDPAAALDQAAALRAAGAWAIDVGAESTHPDAEQVTASEELKRLQAVVPALLGQGLRVSVDTYKPDVMREVLAWGATLINDVTGMRNPDAIAAVAESDCQVIAMYSRASGGKAERGPGDPGTIVSEVEAYFDQRLEALAAAGIARARLILDPGMGFFLGGLPSVSVEVLQNIARLRTRFDLPVLISTSRKSIIGQLLAPQEEPRPTEQRAAGTLASELFAVEQGAAYIRTHDVQQLRDALVVLQQLRGTP